MKAFLDTNILLDFLIPERRSPEVAIIFQAARDHLFEVQVTTQSLVDCAYIASRCGIAPESFRRFAGWVVDHFNVEAVSSFQIRDALADPDHDFEDNVQAASAWDGCCDVIITRDRHFPATPSIPVLTAGEFVQAIS